MNMSLPLNLWKINEDIRGWAAGFGLDFFEVVFELVSNEKVNEIAAYGGFPVRYPHWRFGMEYDRMAKSHLYGLHKIYEMVINNDPCYAYLVDGASQIDYKLIMAHVYAHSDFFKSNLWFEHTNRKMMDEMANHATRIRRYIDRHGLDKVERFIDACLSIDSLIDYHFPDQVEKRAEKPDEAAAQRAEKEEADHRFRVKTPEYLEEFLYPEEYVKAEKKKKAESKQRAKRNPPYPMKDVMSFLIRNAPLEEWEWDVLSMMRKEALYFAPQGQTKIMNEGWAAYWHSKILTEKALDASEIVDFADNHSKAVAVQGMQINPYKLGLEIYRDIEDRWNRGRFGKEYEECTDARKRRMWDRRLDLGRQKIFEVRKIYNDVSFLDEFLTPEFCLEHKLFTWAFKEQLNRCVIDSRRFEAIKEQLLSQITNFGHPLIHVIESNFQNRGELLLHHTHQGTDLDLQYAQDVLANLALVWRRPVHILTTVGPEEQLWSSDGEKFETHKIVFKKEPEEPTK
jgi:stage V sporulation protein R